ncbi:hypothetical protein N7G274_000321 [Stereocaulon virgatum]|uniref:Uncharacterized protein n=1 Tax=Stereocaulon virgatum TaxID=373712 RepID=A0ABR4ARU3_9LECA
MIYYLNLDGPRSLKTYTPTLEIPRCAGSSKTRSWEDRTYCNTYRAHGYMEYCRECGVRTCVRRSDYRWKKWMDEEKERKERKAAQALVAAQQEEQTRDSIKGKERRKAKAPSALETYMSEHEPAVWIRSGVRDVERKDSEHRDERLAKDPSRKGWETQGIVFGMPVIEELSMNADEEMVDEMVDEEEEQ